MQYIFLFTMLGPIIIGATTISSFWGNRKQPIINRTAPLRKPLFLAAAIVLLLLIPGYFIYTTLTHPVPSGYYDLSVPYEINGYEEIYDSVNHTYTDRDYHYDGIAPANIYIDYDVEYREEGYNFYGQPITKAYQYTNIELTTIKLDCFDGKKFEIYEDADYGEYSIEYNNVEYTLSVSIGAINDESLGYTIEDRISDISTTAIIEYIVLMLFDILGIIGYFIAIRIEKKQNFSN